MHGVLTEMAKFSITLDQAGNEFHVFNVLVLLLILGLVMMELFG